MIIGSTDENGLNIKIEGDSSLQMAEEESSDSEVESTDDNQDENRIVSSAPDIPTELSQSSSGVAIGSAVITNSSNVHVGNNYFFNGPYSVKQILESGIANLSYKKTEGEDMSVSRNLPSGEETNQNQGSSHKYALSRRDKIALMTVILGGLVLAAIVCAVLLTIQRNQDVPDVDGLHDEHYSTSNGELLIAPDHLRVVSRTDWLAQPSEHHLSPIRQPVPWVIIAHTAQESCFTQSECVLKVRLVQMFHIESRGWDDIGYNFLVGGDGSAYVGRGWDYIGAHTKGYNKYSISIAFIGTFNTEKPTKQQVEACEKLISLGVKKGKLAKDYKLFGHRQLMSTLSPGKEVFNIMKEWPNFVTNVSAVPVPDY